MSAKHKAMVQRTNVRGTAYWAGVAEWRDTIDAAKHDAAAFRADEKPGEHAPLRIYTISSEPYTS